MIPAKHGKLVHDALERFRRETNAVPGSAKSKGSGDGALVISGPPPPQATPAPAQPASDVLPLATPLARLALVVPQPTEESAQNRPRPTMTLPPPSVRQPGHAAQYSPITQSGDTRTNTPAVQSPPVPAPSPRGENPLLYRCSGYTVVTPEEPLATPSVSQSAQEVPPDQFVTSHGQRRVRDELNYCEQGPEKRIRVDSDMDTDSSPSEVSSQGEEDDAKDGDWEPSGSRGRRSPADSSSRRGRRPHQIPPEHLASLENIRSTSTAPRTFGQPTHRRTKMTASRTCGIRIPPANLRHLF